MAKFLYSESRRNREMPLSEVISSMEAETMGEGPERGRGLIKCRIPQMMSQKRGRTPPVKTHGINSETPRPRSAASRYKDPSAHSPTHPAQGSRQARSDKAHAVKRPSNLPKITLPPTLRPPRTVIKIPISTGSNPGNTYINPIYASRNKNEHDLTDQQTISNCEDRGDLDGIYQNNNRACEIHRNEPVNVNANKKIQLKIHWQENIVKFENIKRQLHEQQRNLIELYATLRSCHGEMLELGQTVYLPPPEDLTIMNVAKLTPDQLLQLCAGTLRTQVLESSDTNTTHEIDINVLHEIPNKIVATCEETLNSRKAIIDWFEDVMTKKMITKTVLVNKINKFKTETEEFRSSLEKNKEDYLRFVKETSDIITQSASALLANQLRSEESTTKLSEMHALNEDLRRKLRAAEQQIKYTANRPKLEELEKELKEEKYKRTTLRDRLSRAEVQVKIKDEKIAQLKAAWDETNSRCMASEQSVIQLREENQKLQSGYDIKMQKLNESIDKNTKHLEEIMEDRSKLLTEKEDLEKRLSELSKHYEEALHDTKHESNSSVAKLIEAEKKYNEVMQEKKCLQHKIDSLTAQLLESEGRFKDITKKLSDVEYTSRDAAECRKEIENLKRQFDDINNELIEYKELAAKQTEAIKELEENWKNATELEQLLKRDLSCKEKQILELENQRTLLEQRLQESESKRESYAAQLSNLENHISHLQEEVGEFESWEELREMVKQQSKRLRESIQQNDLLSEALKKKEIELQQQIETITEQGHLLEERDAVVKTLTDKDEEQTNIIKLLRNNLEMRTQADVEFNQQIAEKNTEIESLMRNVEMRKQQISQLEKIILTLENQTLKLSIQKRKARETIQGLEKKLLEYETYFMTNIKNMPSTADNLDELIDILEYELANPIESQPKRKSQEYVINSQTVVDRQGKQEKHNKFRRHPENASSMFHPDENVPTKIVMGNYVKKTYIPNEDKHKGDNLGRKKAITSIESSEWAVLPEIDVSTPVPYPKDKKITIPPLPAQQQSTKNPFCLIPNYIGDEKKFKMFKFAGHRL